MIQIGVILSHSLRFYHGIIATLKWLYNYLFGLFTQFWSIHISQIPRGDPNILFEPIIDLFSSNIEVVLGKLLRRSTIIKENIIVELLHFEWLVIVDLLFKLLYFKLFWRKLLVDLHDRDELIER